VFCHGIWADGSCFNKVIPALHGYDVMAAQYGLDTNEGRRLEQSARRRSTSKIKRSEWIFN